MNSVSGGPKLPVDPTVGRGLIEKSKGAAATPATEELKQTVVPEAGITKEAFVDGQPSVGEALVKTGVNDRDVLDGHKALSAKAFDLSRVARSFPYTISPEREQVALTLQQHLGKTFQELLPADANVVRTSRSAHAYEDHISSSVGEFLRFEPDGGPKSPSLTFPDGTRVRAGSLKSPVYEAERGEVSVTREGGVLVRTYYAKVDGMPEQIREELDASGQVVKQDVIRRQVR